MTPYQFLNDACTPPDRKDISKAILTLKNLGALSLYSPDKPEVNTPPKSAPSTGQERDLKYDDRISYNPVKLDQKDLDDGSLTPMGRIMVTMPLDLSFSRLIYFGIHLGLVDEAIVIAACTELNIWDENQKKEPETMIDQLKTKIYWSRQSDSDHIANLKAFQMWINKMPQNFRGDISARQAQVHE